MSKPKATDYHNALKWVNDYKKTVKNDITMRNFLKLNRLRDLDIIAMSLSSSILKAMEEEEQNELCSV